MLIVKGFAQQKLISMGAQDQRLSQLVLTLRDDVSHMDESGAITLMNLALDEADFLRRSFDNSELELKQN